MRRSAAGLQFMTSGMHEEGMDMKVPDLSVSAHVQMCRRALLGPEGQAETFSKSVHTPDFQKWWCCRGVGPKFWGTEVPL